MVSKDKLIKQGINYTEQLFRELTQRLQKGVLDNDTLEAFLEATKEYTTNNPLVSSGYKDTMLGLILAETNNHKFSRPSQRELTRVTIENYVGNQIINVGEDIKARVRDIVTEEYNNPEGSNPQRMAKRISDEVTSIKNKRAKTIARTEIARTSTVSDYIISKERGATHYTVNCRSTRCDICKKRYCNTNPTGGDVEYSIEDTEHLPPLHPNSYHKDTKVFTENGWKYIRDLTGGEKLLSMNPEDESLEFIKPVNLIKHKEAKLVHIYNKWFDVSVTPDHDCFIHQRRDGGNKGRYYESQFRKPSELNSESYFVRCIDTDRESPESININGLEFEPSDFAFFMAWYISEGSVLHDKKDAEKRKYPIQISQLKEDNSIILEKELKRIFNYLGLKMIVGKEYFITYSKELYDYLLPLGYSYEKYIPDEIFSLNKECLNIFLDNYILGYGSERIRSNDLVTNGLGRYIYTSSVKLVSDLSYLILLAGYYPSISSISKAGKVCEFKNGTYVQNHDVYGISVNRSKHTSYDGCNVDIIDYNDYVYCVELPKWHTLWVMSNGKTSWNGNCRCSANFYIKEGFEPKTRTDNVDKVQVEKAAKVELENVFTKDFYTLVSQAEGTQGIELKPIYSKLKKKYKSKVKNRAEFEELFTKAVMSTNTRLYPARDPDLKVIFGKGTNKKGFGYIDRSKIRKPVETVTPKKPGQNITNNELYESMTKADKKKYDKAKKTIENMKKGVGVDNPLFEKMTEKHYKTINDLESKQRAKLVKKGKKETKTSLTQAQEKELETFKQETPLNEFDKVMEWADKRVKGKIEYGYKFDTRTGKLVGEEIRGSKGKVTMQDDGEQMGSLHVHTRDGMSFPSDTDIISYRCMREKDHYVLSKNEVWYVRAEENFGMMGRLTQIDITQAYANCIKEGNAAVEKLMREGKIGLDEKSITKAADKEIGDRILEEFAQSKWRDKGLMLRRAYR